MNAPPPPKHHWVLTEDGSLTLFSEEFQESCHSTSGARSETMLHYVNGCAVPERATKKEYFTILEVGFGLGMGLESTLDALREHPYPWRFMSLEMDRALVEWYRQKNPHLKWSGNLLEGKLGQCQLTVLVGDARKTLPQFVGDQKVCWDAIYQDAFSPRRNPVLWTREWFTLLKDHASKDVVLSTYSSSSSIRKSMLEAGWKVRNGEKFGPKRSSTRATLQGESDPEILLHLERSKVHALTDDNLEEFLRK